VSSPAPSTLLIVIGSDCNVALSTRIRHGPFCEGIDPLAVDPEHRLLKLPDCSRIPRGFSDPEHEPLFLQGLQSLHHSGPAHS
jgi:hypothetical protein